MHGRAPAITEIKDVVPVRETWIAVEPLQRGFLKGTVLRIAQVLHRKPIGLVLDPGKDPAVSVGDKGAGAEMVAMIVGDDIVLLPGHPKVYNSCLISLEGRNLKKPDIILL